MGEEIFIVFIVFGSLVAMLGLVLHYSTKWKAMKGLSAEDEQTLEDLRGEAEKMERRLDSLEHILDDEVPDWRSRRHDPL